MPRPAEILASIRDQLRGSKSVALGQFQIINLDLIKNVAGDRWDELKQKIFDVSEAFIAHRLHASDALFRCDEGFLVVFATDRADVAEAQATWISHDLNRFYVGDEVFRKLKVTSRALRLDQSELAAFFAAQGVSAKEESRAGEEKVKEEEAQYQPESLRTRVAYEPVYDVTRQALISSFCLPVRNVAGVLHFGHRHEYPFEAHVTAKRDFDVQMLVLDALETSWSKGHAAAVCLTPHYRTLVDPQDRQEYFARLKALPEHLHKAVTIRIDGTPDGAPMGRLQEITGTLRTLKMKFLVHCHSLDFEIERYEGCGVQAFGGALKDLTRGSPISGELQDKLAQLVGRSARMGSDVYAAAVARRTSFVVLRELGVRWFSGPFIAPMLSKLPLVQPLSLADLSVREDRLDRQAAPLPAE